MRRVFALLFAALPLAACSTADPSQTLPEITFEHMAPLRIEAATLEIDNAYRPPMDRAHIEGEAPVAPAEALVTWAKDRLHPTGSPGTLRFVVQEGSLVEQELTVEKGVRGAFKNQPAYRYTAVVEGQLELLNAPGISRIATVAKAERSTSVREDATLNERDRALFDLVEKLMADFNRQMEAGLQRYFANYMR